MAGMKFDMYSRRAEVLPTYLCVLPAVLLLSVLVPGDPIPKLVAAGISGAALFPLSFLFAQAGRKLGKILEVKLWEEWGGAPTTRFLRYGNDEFNPDTRKRLHDKLRALGLDVPTETEQTNDPARADLKFEACTA